MADNNEIINCPACGCEMEKIFMPSLGINLDVCTKGCGGIYFDNRELKAFDELHEDIAPLEELFKNKKFKHIDETETKICPVCGTAMVKNYTSPNKVIQIDECYNCGGKFLDYSELQKIRSLNPQKNIQTQEYKDFYPKLNLSDYSEPFSKFTEKDRTVLSVVAVLFGIFFIILILYLCSKYNVPTPLFHVHFWKLYPPGL